MPQSKALTFGLFVAFIAAASVSSERNARGQAGMPGLPGGMGGAGGNGGGSGGGLGGAPGQAGMPGSGDLSFALEDFLPMFNAGQLQPTSKPRPSARPKIIIGEECENVDGVVAFVDSSTPKKKKDWMALILKLSADGHKTCATNLSEQLLSL